MSTVNGSYLCFPYVYTYTTCVYVFVLRLMELYVVFSLSRFFLLLYVLFRSYHFTITILVPPIHMFPGYTLKVLRRIIDF